MYGQLIRIAYRRFQIAPSGFGVWFNGIRFSIFVKRAHKSMGNTLLDLAAPFSYFDWVLVATTIFILALTLKLTGFDICRALFWLAASLLDQGECRREHVISKNKHLIISWLFVAFLLRNLYTSDLYSMLTKNPMAQHLPKSFKELILNHSLPLLSTTEHRSYLLSVTHSDVARNDYPFAIYQRLRDAAYYLWRKVVKPNELIEMLSEQKTIEIVKGMLLETIKNFGDFKDWERFGFLHEANHPYGESAAYLKPIIQAYGGVDLYTNNEAPVLVSPLLLYLKYRHFFSETFFNAIAHCEKSETSFGYLQL